MKRFFILASAAIVALASCAKTEVVYKDAPQEIAFKALTGVMTKAPVLSTAFPDDQSMTVYAWNHADNAAYFTQEFAKSEDSWAGTTAQYYPTTGSLNFVAYTTNDVVTPAVTDYETYTYTLADNTTVQHDLMVSEYVHDQASTSTAVGMKFNHALALLEVNFMCTGTAVTVNSVTITGTKQEGVVVVTYEVDEATGNVAPIIGTWDVTEDDDVPMTETHDATLTAGAEAENFAHFLVVPEDGDEKDLTVAYTLNGNPFTHTIDLGEIDDATAWETGKKYVYNVTIGLDEIRLSPSVEPWAAGATPTIPSI